MSSLLIKQAEKPKDCGHCWAVDFNVCGFTHKDVAEEVYRGEYAKDCPMVEIPTPHGRLIDADELCDNLLSKWDTADEQGQKIISEVMARVVTPIVVRTPTVIEADEGEDD